MPENSKLSEKPATVVIIEDDLRARQELQELLEFDNYNVISCSGANDLDRITDRSKVDLYLVDIGLRDANGLDLVKKIHSQSHAGLIIVSGRNESSDKIVGLQLGADDYITKPFNPRELSARVGSLIRRIKNTSEMSPISGTSKVDNFKDVQFSNIILSGNLRCLIDSNGTKVKLTTAEFEILYLLVSSPNKVFTRESIITNLKGQEWAGYDRAIDGLVSRLRKILKSIDPSVPFIKTIHGTGYSFIGM